MVLIQLSNKTTTKIVKTLRENGFWCASDYEELFLNVLFTKGVPDSICFISGLQRSSEKNTNPHNLAWLVTSLSRLQYGLQRVQTTPSHEMTGNQRKQRKPQRLQRKNIETTRSGLIILRLQKHHHLESCYLPCLHENNNLPTYVSVIYSMLSTTSINNATFPDSVWHLAIQQLSFLLNSGQSIGR